MKTGLSRKVLAAALALLLFAGMTGCGINLGGGKNTVKLPTMPVNTQSETTTQQPTETTATALRLDELVTVGKWLHLAGNDGYNDYDCWYIVPQIQLASGDAAECNAEIMQICERSMADAQTSHDEGYSLLDIGISYEASLCDGLLSLLLKIQNDWGMTGYYAYMLDTATGEEIDNDDLFARLGMSESECETFIYETTKAFFETSNENALEMGYADDTFYRQQYEKTMAEENLDTAQLFLNTDGELILCVNVYGFAGADCYLYLVPTARITPQIESCEGLFSPQSIDES